MSALMVVAEIIGSVRVVTTLMPCRLPAILARIIVDRTSYTFFLSPTHGVDSTHICVRSLCIGGF